MKFQATQSQPGSEEKIQVLEWRYANMKPLWHRGDKNTRPELCDNGYGGPPPSTPKQAVGDGVGTIVETDFDDNEDDFCGDLS